MRRVLLLVAGVAALALGIAAPSLATSITTAQEDPVITPGPDGLVSHTGTSWHLPNCAVE